MNILIVNDDGYQGKGLHALIRALKDDYDLTVVAPRKKRSGTSNHITYLDPLVVEKRRLDFLDMDVHIVDGTPADCGYLGIGAICQGKPDLVVSGINDGQNIAEGLLYSGTIAGALQGALSGIPAVALSTAAHGDFDGAAAYFARLLPILCQKKHPAFYNINFPHGPVAEAKGMRKAKVAGNRFAEFLDRRPGPQNREYFWHIYQDTANFQQEREGNLPSFYVGDFQEGDDVALLEEGYITITPLKIQYLDEKRWGVMDDLVQQANDLFENKENWLL